MFSAPFIYISIRLDTLYNINKVVYDERRKIFLLSKLWELINQVVKY